METGVVVKQDNHIKKRNKFLLSKINVSLDDMGHVFNNFDKVFLSILLDSIEHNDEPFQIIKKQIFDPEQQIEELDVKDSVVLRLAYMKKS